MKTADILLRDKDKKRILQLLAEHLPDVSVWVYGSRVNGDAHDASDLDIVLRSADLSPIPLEELEAFLSALRDSTIPILIEARDWARLPQSIHSQILQKYVMLT